MPKDHLSKHHKDLIPRGIKRYPSAFVNLSWYLSESLHTFKISFLSPHILSTVLKGGK